MAGSGITIDATMLTPTVRVDRIVETYVGRAVLREDMFRVVGSDGRRDGSRLLFLVPAIMSFLNDLPLEAASRVRKGSSPLEGFPFRNWSSHYGTVRVYRHGAKLNSTGPNETVMLYWVRCQSCARLASPSGTLIEGAGALVGGARFPVIDAGTVGVYSVSDASWIACRVIRAGSDRGLMEGGAHERREFRIL